MKNRFTPLVPCPSCHEAKTEAGRVCGLCARQGARPEDFAATSPAKRTKTARPVEPLRRPRKSSEKWKAA